MGAEREFRPCGQCPQEFDVTPGEGWNLGVLYLLLHWKAEHPIYYATQIAEFRKFEAALADRGGSRPDQRGEGAMMLSATRGDWRDIARAIADMDPGESASWRPEDTERMNKIVTEATERTHRNGRSS